MNNQNSTQVVLGIMLLVIAGVCAELYREQRELRNQFASIVDVKNSPATHIDFPPTTIVERFVEKTQEWRGVQESVKDTVVQVFAQIAEVDMLQPYKTPAQYPVYGSGFFINDQGDLITNAHVVNQSKTVWIQIPSLGKRVIEVDVLSVSPDRDLALLRVKPADFAVAKQVLGKVPCLKFGDSDIVRRADDVMALGYPLGQQTLKSTTGVISGREGQFIQMSAAINPGNSGGPLLNIKGEVIGVNTAIAVNAQNIGYIIPINDLKVILQDMYSIPLLRKPFLGVWISNGTEVLAKFLGNPEPGGGYVVEVIENSTLAKAGVKRGDMIYEINDHAVDIYGEMSVPWSEDKISLIDYVARLSVGQEISLVVYRGGKCKNIKVALSKTELPAIRKIYPGYEEFDYEVFAGMVVMQLTVNHIHLLAQNSPGLMRFGEMSNQTKPVLVVTHIFPSSQLYRSRTINAGSTINEINGFEVHTLAELRKALREGDRTYLTLRASDNVMMASEHILVTLPFEKVLEEETKLSRDYKYPLSEVAQLLLKEREQRLVLSEATCEKNSDA